MGKIARSPQNGEVPEETQPTTRLRPEEIVARSFTTPVAAETNGGDGWSPKARRLFLAGMAVVGAVVVTAGLLLTGELGPTSGTSRPLETGPAGGALSGNLLPGVDQQPPATPVATPTPTTAAGPKTRTVGPTAVAALTPGTDAAQLQPAPSTASPSPQTQAQTPAPAAAPTTTVPCSLLGSKALGAQLPPLCR